MQRGSWTRAANSRPYNGKRQCVPVGADFISARTRFRFPPRPVGSSCPRGDDQSPALAGAPDASTCSAAAGHGRNLSLRHPAPSRRSVIGRRAECPHAAGTRCVVVAAPVVTAAGHGRIYNAPLRQGWQRVRSMVVRQTWRVAGRCGHRPLRHALKRQ